MTTHELTPATFVEKWKASELSERAASQSHFNDLCHLLDQPTPTEFDPTGTVYTFEKGANVTGPASKGSKGDYGFADVWWKDKFAWEYKRKDKYKSLDEAYGQLLKYREALDSPPLLIVSDIDRIEIHTNFTATSKAVHKIALDQLTDPGCLDKLRRVFTNPDSFKPTQTTEGITAEVAAQFGHIAQKLRERGHDPHAAAHFLMKCMFCLFAEDIRLLPNTVFKTILDRTHKQPERFEKYAGELFAAMGAGGDAMLEQIPYFNGGLFDDAPPLPLTKDDLGVLLLAAGKDWSAVEPAIFGTLFERSLDPAKRAQIGAHYTSREDILLVIEPVVMAPLRREWSEVQAKVDEQLARRRAVKTKETRQKADDQINRLLQDFIGRLASVRILDPACGSGNFLYVAIQQLLYLEKEVINYSARPEIGQTLIPQVRPTQLHGIEINPYAAELAQVVIWIGYLQWMHDNGFNVPRDPILAPLQTIENRDAILAWADRSSGKSIPTWQEGAKCLGAAAWPEVDFIVGNPPFLGCRQFRMSGLSGPYVDTLHNTYTLPKTSDLCCYWFDRAWQASVSNPACRTGLLATQAIRSSDNRAVLHQIASIGRIFMAWADRPWILDGASVRVAIVGFAPQADDNIVLDGQQVREIHSDLSAGIDLTTAHRLSAMSAISFQGPVKVGEFNVDTPTAGKLLAEPAGPSGQQNAEVLKPWYNGTAVTRRYEGDWIVDFATMALEDAALFPAPFEYVQTHVKPFRDKQRREGRRSIWWLFGEPNPRMRKLLTNLPRFIATPRVSKHRIFVWLDAIAIPDARLVGIADGTEYMFGVLHSSIHELWSLNTCAWHGVGNDPTYNNKACFDTFAPPWAPDCEGSTHTAYQRIAAAAKELNDLRERWLNPPEWIEPIARIIDAQDDFVDVPEQARPLIRQSAIMAAAAKDAKLKKRTLTNLYNERPTWLRMAHEKLDRAVLAAYAATDPQGDWSEAWAEVWTETGAGQPLPENHPLAAHRAEIDQKVLANLLRLNQQRAGVVQGRQATATQEDVAEAPPATLRKRGPVQGPR